MLRRNIAAVVFLMSVTMPWLKAQDVVQHHNHANRDGLYIDPLINQTSATTIHRDLSFDAPVPGQVWAQPLYVSNGPGGTPAFIVVTETNAVVALSEADGSLIWENDLGTPVPRTKLPCGDIMPTLGITGTPVIDTDARTIFLDAMTTPDDGTTKQHLIYALALDDGSVVPGWPVDVNSLSYAGINFDSEVQNQRGALLLNAGVLYVPYGGHFGDCHTSDGRYYHGWVVAVQENDPTSAVAWATEGRQAGIWAPTGLATDGSFIYAGTGNTTSLVTCPVPPPPWLGGEAVIRLGLDDTFSGSPTDYFAPSNWCALDLTDLDLGDQAPLLVDVPGATPEQLIVALGKSGVAHLLDRNNLGGIGTGDGISGEGLFSKQVATRQIRTSAAVFTVDSGTYVVFAVNTPGQTGVGCPPGMSGDLVALRINPSNPPTITVAWCANDNGPGSPLAGRGSPIVTSPCGSTEPVIWTIGAEGTNRLYAYNGETGQVLFNGGGPNELMTLVRRFSTPIAVNGRIFVAGDNRLYAFTTQ